MIFKKNMRPNTELSQYIINICRRKIKNELRVACIIKLREMKRNNIIKDGK